MAEPGLTPRAAASTAPAVGSRKRERVHGGGRVRSRRPRTWCPLSSPTRYGARGSRRRRGRGGAVWSSTAAAYYARGKGQGSTWPPRDRHARVLGCTVMRGVGLAKRRVRAQARTRTRPARRGVVDSKGIARRARRHRKARLRKRRALTKAAAPARSCIPAWHEGRHHQRRRGGAVHSTPARWPGNHKREAAVILTSVATSRSEGRQCSVAVRLASEEEEEEGGGASSGK
jgi:hypothetical protein